MTTLNVGPEAITNLMAGVIPERQAEFDTLVKNHTALFRELEDSPGFFLEAGAFGAIQFTQRTMWQHWMLAFAAKEALHTHSSFLVILLLQGAPLEPKELARLPGQQCSVEKYSKIVAQSKTLAEALSIQDYVWPSFVPNPNNGKPHDIEGAAVFDLACMATAYTFLHELKHVMFAVDEKKLDAHLEELECDKFAREMMLDRVNSYAKKSGYDAEKIKTKRAIGIALASFFMLVITPVEKWRGSDSHPSLRLRIENTINNLALEDNDLFWLYLASILATHMSHLGVTYDPISFASLRELCEVLIREADENGV